MTRRSFHRFVRTAWRAVKQSWSLKDAPQWLSGYEDNTAGIEVNEHTALNVSAWFAAQRIIAEDSAKLPFKVHRMIGRARPEAVKHPVFRLLHSRANPYQTAFQFRRTLVAHAVGVGNGIAWIEFSRGGFPKALWNLRPDRVRWERDRSTGKLVYFVTADDGRPEERLESWEVLHLPGMGWDGFTGYNPIRFAAQTLGNALAAERVAGALFGNGLNASGTIEHPGQLSDAAQERLVKSIDQRHGGPRKALRLLVLEEGMKFTKQTITPDEAQFLGSREFGVVDIARWARVQPRKLFASTGDSDTYQNVEHVNIEHATDALMPWCVALEQECDLKLFTEKEQQEYFTKHSFPALMRGDYLSRMRGFLIERTIGSLSVNEIRAFEERDPVDGGDDYSPLRLAGSAPGDGQSKDDTDTSGSKRDTSALVRPLLHDAWLRVTRRFARSLERAASKIDADQGPYVASERWLRTAHHDLEAFAQKILEPTLALVRALSDDDALMDHVSTAPFEWCERLRTDTACAIAESITTRTTPGARMAELAQAIQERSSPYQTLPIEEAA